MEKIIAFLILSIPIVYISWRTLFNIRSHGFYRFFSWECILWLLVSNIKYWFTNPFSVYQIISWTLLIISGYLIIVGPIMMKKLGKPNENRDGNNLYQFEKTSQLVDKGIFKYIRHPLYASLLYFGWGIYFKNPDYILLIISILSTIFLYITAKMDESECSAFFGNQYTEYKKKTKMFIPYIF